MIEEWKVEGRVSWDPKHLVLTIILHYITYLPSQHKNKFIINNNNYNLQHHISSSSSSSYTSLLATDYLSSDQIKEKK